MSLCATDMIIVTFGEHHIDVPFPKCTLQRRETLRSEPGAASS